MAEYRIGIAGYCCDTGLGTANRTFFRHLDMDQWLVIEHPNLGIRADYLSNRCTILSQSEIRSSELRTRRRVEAAIDDFLSKIDFLFIIERTFIPGISQRAKARGVRLVLIPNWEWLDPEHDDMSLIDCFIAPTAATERYLAAHGLEDRTVRIPHPIDTELFSFSRRTIAKTFVHYSGWGGYKGRKGTRLVIDVAKGCPNIDFVVFSQNQIDICLPNVRQEAAVRDPQLLYQVGDVAVQPSRWEGVGLQILEAMSSGMPVVTTNAPPMSEYSVSPRLLVRASPSSVHLWKKEWTAWDVAVSDLAAAIQNLHGQDISVLSDASRRKMEERSWQMSRPFVISAIRRMKR